MSAFYRGILWGAFLAFPLASWVILTAYVIGRAS